MPEIKEIPVISELKVAGTSINIISKYEDADAVPYVLRAELKTDSGFESGIPYKEGDLAMDVKFLNDKIFIYFDGPDLVIDSFDSHRYYINSDFELEYDDQL